MSSHTHHRPMSPQQYNALLGEAKARAHVLREHAIDAAWSMLVRKLRQAASQMQQMLSPQSRTQRKEASHAGRSVTRRGQNRPRGPLRLMDP